MLILFFVNCERTVLFSVKRDLDPPPLPPFTTLIQSRTQLRVKMMVSLLLLLLFVCLFSRNTPPVYFTSFIYTWLFENRFGKDEDSFYSLAIKDVRAHCYCASLVRTLYMTWRLPLHVFQARASSRNSTKYRADELCGNLISEYFCWMPDDPHFFFPADHFLY